MIKTLLIVFFGGGLGSAMRYGVQMILHLRILPYHFPWATLMVNIAGSFLIGLFYALSARFHWSEGARLLLTAGICGGFTTFSTFSNDSLELLRQGEIAMFAVYIGLSIILGITAVFAGAAIAR